MQDDDNDTPVRYSCLQGNIYKPFYFRVNVTDGRTDSIATSFYCDYGTVTVYIIIIIILFRS